MNETNWKRLIGPLSALVALVVLLVAFGAVMTAAFSSNKGGSGVAGDGASGFVEPDLTLPPMNIAVDLTDEGIEPQILFVPAGRTIRLLLRNRGEQEHHFRISGLDTEHLRWMMTPEVSQDEIDSLSEEDLAYYGLSELHTMTDEAEIEHVLHHIEPWFQATRQVSPTGIKPLGTEVHGWVIRGTVDLMEFQAVETGEFIAEDVRFPEFTSRVIVFDPAVVTSG